MGAGKECNWAGIIPYDMPEHVGYSYRNSFYLQRLAKPTLHMTWISTSVHLQIRDVITHQSAKYKFRLHSTSQPYHQLKVAVWNFHTTIFVSISWTESLGICYTASPFFIKLPITSTSTVTHLPLNKMAAISQTIFSYAFSWIKSFVFWLKCHWILFLRVQLTLFQHWLR